MIGVSSVRRESVDDEAMALDKTHNLSQNITGNPVKVDER